MSDTSLNSIIRYGTDAERLAFVPNPAVGSQVLYIWYTTDTLITYVWDGAAWVQISSAGGGNINVSAGTTSNNLTNIVFSNSNGLSFGLNGSTITASASQSNQALSAANGSFTFQTAQFSNANGVSFITSAGSAIAASIATSLTNINFSAGTTSNNLSNLIFSNSNNVSFGLDGSTVTATVTVATSLTNVNISAGTTSNNLSAFVFSNSNNVTFGLNGSTVTASAAGGAGGGGGTFNYFQNVDEISDFRAVAFESRIWVMPFLLPAFLSAEYLRYPISVLSLTNRTFGATSDTTSWSAQQVVTFQNQLYTRGTGVSSESFFSLSNYSAGLTARTAFSGGAAGSNYTASLLFTYPFGTGTSTFSNSYACTSASYVINNSGISSAFSNLRWMEIPFNTTLSASNYWLGFAKSTTTTNNGGATGLSTTNFALSIVVGSQTTQGISRINQTITNPGLFLAMGALTTNANILTTASFHSTEIQAGGAAQAVIVPFQVL